MRLVIETGSTVAQALKPFDVQVKIIERERSRAEDLARRMPECEILHGDATDAALLRAERIPQAQTFVALSGHDETNLMACLLAQELGVRRLSIPTAGNATLMLKT